MKATQRGHEDKNDQEMHRGEMTIKGKSSGRGARRAGGEVEDWVLSNCTKVLVASIYNISYIVPVGQSISSITPSNRDSGNFLLP